MNATTYSGYTVTTANSELPVTLDMARFHLRNEELRFDDALLTHYIKAAAAYVERTYGLALLNQTITETHTGFPCASNEPLFLRIRPVTAISSVKYYDSTGTQQTWNSGQYKFGAYNLSAFIVPNVGYSFPIGLETTPNAVEIVYTAGFGSKSSAIDTSIVQALMLAVADSYQKREDTVVALPKASEILLLPWYRFAA